MGEPVEGGPGEPLGAQNLGPVLEGQVRGHDQTGALVSGRDDVEEQLGADLGGGHVAQLVEDEEVELGQLALEPEERALVSRLDVR